MTTAVASRTHGILQVRRTAECWTITPVIYDSGITYLPLEMTAKQAIDLFTVCRLPKASLAQDSFIAELETKLSHDQLCEIGFNRMIRA